MSTAAVCIPTLLSTTTTYCTVPTCSATSLCLVSVWPCVVFFPLSLFLPFLPAISALLCFVASVPSCLLFLNSSSLTLSLFSYLAGFVPLLFLICVNLPSFWALSSLSRPLSHSSFLPSFAPSASAVRLHRVSQSPWWCAPCTLPPPTVLPPSCVNMLVIWAAPPCAESRVGGWKETEPTWACTGLDLWVHTHTHTHTHAHTYTHTHIYTVIHAHTSKHTKNIQLDVPNWFNSKFLFIQFGKLKQSLKHILYQKSIRESFKKKKTVVESN